MSLFTFTLICSSSMHLHHQQLISSETPLVFSLQLKPEVVSRSYLEKQFNSYQRRSDKGTSTLDRIIHLSLNQNINLKKKIENKNQNIQIIKNSMRISCQSLLDAVQTGQKFLCLYNLQASPPNSPTVKGQQAQGKSGFYKPKTLQNKESTSLIKKDDSVNNSEMEINCNMTNLRLLYPLIGSYNGNRIMQKIELDEDTLHEAIYQS